MNLNISKIHFNKIQNHQTNKASAIPMLGKNDEVSFSNEASKKLAIINNLRSYGLDSAQAQELFHKHYNTEEYNAIINGTKDTDGSNLVEHNVSYLIDRNLTPEEAVQAVIDFPNTNSTDTLNFYIWRKEKMPNLTLGSVSIGFNTVKKLREEYENRGEETKKELHIQ